MLSGRTAASLICGVLLAAAPVDVTWAAPDGFVRRLEALAVLQTLRAELLGHDSSTAVLQAWCEAHGPPGLKIVAQHDPKAEQAPSEAARKALDLKPGQAVRYRRVKLACGQAVLSEADNWYLPERLTPEMNHTLDTSDAPFGQVVRPLDFRRRFLSAELLEATGGWMGEGRAGRRSDRPHPRPRPAGHRRPDHARRQAVQLRRRDLHRRRPGDGAAALSGDMHSCLSPPSP